MQVSQEMVREINECCYMHKEKLIIAELSTLSVWCRMLASFLELERKL